MVSVLTWILKLNRKRIILLICTFLMLISLAGCDPYEGKFPCSYNARWVCNDPQMVLEYEWPREHWLVAQETMEYNGEIQYIHVSYRGPTFEAFPADSNNFEDMLFCGEWEYRELGMKLVLKLSEDHIFDGAYEELVFERHDYYCEEDFSSIKLGESTHMDVYKIAPYGKLKTTPDGGVCEYPMKNGDRIRIKFSGDELVVEEIEVVPPEDKED